MTWDEFNHKFSKIADRSDPNIMRIVLDEFGSWDNLAFAILDMIVYDRVKYSSICLSCEGDKDSAQRLAMGMYWTKQIEKLKQEFQQEFK